MLRLTRRLNMVIISVKYFLIRLQVTKLCSGTILLQGRAVTLTFKEGTQLLRATRRLNMVVISV